ncbi:MAG: 7-carboxy-7-deazaguanine synthase QueE [Candidatus Niyogibacteria bacterium]|nr:7-carboxy-7-deazaguanine synthase QueE [Candidatus Niyogibacteria bacterium]
MEESPSVHTKEGVLDKEKVKERFAVSGDRTFFTEQGEGITVGEPAVFFRLHHCNLDCTWCDTPYTWNKRMPEFYKEREVWSFDETIQNIVLDWNEGIKNYQEEGKGIKPRLVITGGEPMIQCKQIDKFLRRPELKNWEVEIETNGTIPPPKEFPEQVQFNCSPKLENSGVPRKKRINPEAIKALKERNTYFKFVVRDEKDIDEIMNDYMPLLEDFPRERIYISPEGVDAKTLDEVREKVRDRVEQEGFMLGDRLQIRKYGNRRRT